MSLAGTGLVGISQARAVPAAGLWPSCEWVLSGHQRWQWTRTLGDPGGGAVVGFLLSVMGAWLEVSLFLRGCRSRLTSQIRLRAQLRGACDPNV